jgi:hypothetical protein
MGFQVVRFIFFTKTAWAEPPRLRHQLARLLADAGHEVVFFERPAYPWESLAQNESGHPNIKLTQHHQYLHHKLRIHRALHYLNAIFEKREILHYIVSLKANQSDVIVNFNYDYFFLKDIFPSQKIITIINDDFWSSSIGGYERPLKLVLTDTCKKSNVVFTVSQPLASLLEEFCDPQLFYPWADIRYMPPTSATSRNTLLFWGYINTKIDFDYVERLAKSIREHDKKIRIMFVGPVEKASNNWDILVKDNPTIYYQPATPIDRLTLDSVLACFIPYRQAVAEIDAITLPNKALQFLARGIPLAITGMPDFIEQPFVFRLGRDSDSDLACLREIQDSFYSLQPSIKAFVEDNSAQQRLKTFLDWAE